MFERPLRAAIFGPVLLMLPGVAQAGTVTATGSASFSVTGQCSVTGGVVDMGTYINFTTMRDLGSTIGYFQNAQSTPDPGYYQLGYLTPGSKGDSWANWGTVTCTDGTLYNLKIQGTAPGGYIQIPINGGVTLKFQPMIKTIGGRDMSTNNSHIYTPGIGTPTNWNGIFTSGTGVPQELRGAAYLFLYPYASYSLFQGTYTDALTYTLTF